MIKYTHTCDKGHSFKKLAWAWKQQKCPKCLEESIQRIAAFRTRSERLRPSYPPAKSKPSFSGSSQAEPYPVLRDRVDSTPAHVATPQQPIGFYFTPSTSPQPENSVAYVAPVEEEKPRSYMYSAPSYEDCRASSYSSSSDSSSSDSSSSDSSSSSSSSD